MEKMDAIPKVFLKDPVFKRLEEEAKLAVLSMHERSEYEHSLKVYRDFNAILETERTEGFAAGKAEGIAEGIAEGEAILVRRMSAKGMPTAEIADFTGLSVDKVVNILNDKK